MINQNKMTAVDFFKEELEKELEFKAVEKFWYGLYQQAKEIEKEQKINTLVEFSKAHFDIHTEEAISYITDKAEEYYKLTIKSE